MPDTCDQVICLTLGHEWQPKRMSLEGGGDELIRLPIIGILAHSVGGGWTLLDTGLSPTQRDEPFARKIYRTRAPDFVGDGDTMLEALAECGLTPADITAVAVSHLHVDHTGALEHFTGDTPIYLQRAEHEFGFGDAGLGQGYVREDYEGRDLNWALLDGDATIAPGVDAVSTPGHTPGHMSYRVHLSDGRTWLFAMDAIDLQEGIDRDLPIGSSATEAGAQRHASHARLMEEGRQDGVLLIPGHCPVTWPTMPPPPHGLDLTQVVAAQ
jgi:glyoxylase-like metal-dependent hydrolase (beta-lactamase superfamily II)